MTDHLKKKKDRRVGFEPGTLAIEGSFVIRSATIFSKRHMQKIKHNLKLNFASEIRTWWQVSLHWYFNNDNVIEMIIKTIFVIEYIVSYNISKIGRKLTNIYGVRLKFT